MRISFPSSVSLLLPLLLLFSCQEEQIHTYAPEDSAVQFHGLTNSFSFKGMTEEYRDVQIPVDLIGYCADYDREFKVVAEDSTAVLGRDFTITSSLIKAGEVRGNICLRVNHLPAGVERQDVRLRIVPNEHFREGPPRYSVSDVSWSEEYVRPNPYVWRGWYLFFSRGYSKEYHRLLVSYFGEEIEHVVNQKTPANEDATLVYKLPAWWYSATREFRSFVRQHDDAGLEPPYRHSEDYELYSSYTQAVGEGNKPETPPTILETLNVL